MQGRHAIAKAIKRGTDDVDLLLKQIDKVEAEQLKKVWVRIVASDPRPGGSPESCERYRAFRETLLRVDPVSLTAWDKDPSYGFTALVNDALALCVTREVERSIAEDGALSDQRKKDLSVEFGSVDWSLFSVQQGSQADLAIRRFEGVARKFGLR